MHFTFQMKVQNAANFVLTSPKQAVRVKLQNLTTCPLRNKQTRK